MHLTVLLIGKISLLVALLWRIDGGDYYRDNGVDNK